MVGGVGFPPPSCWCFWEAAAGIGAAEELGWHPKNPQAQRRPFPTPCSSCKVKRGFCNTVFLPCNLLTPLGLDLPGYGTFVPVEKRKGAVDSPAGLDGFRGEAASDVGFARAGERLFAAMRVHVSAYARSLLRPGRAGITFTSTLHHFLPFFPPLPPSATCPIYVRQSLCFYNIIFLTAGNNA